MLNAIFSDMHSNLQAYEAFLKDCKKEKIDRYYCIGDIVGYGANPKECIKLTQELNCPLVCGNHDWAAAGKMSCDYFNQYPKEAILWTQQNIDEADKNYLSNLAFVYEEDGLTLVHGSLNLPEEFNYILDVESAIYNLRLQKTRLCFIGHSHVPVVFFKAKDSYVNYTTEPQIKIEPELFYLINVGSVGQPRGGNWRLCYCIYDDEKNNLRFKRLEYDVKTASKAILNAGLPPYLAHRLEKGR